MAVRRVRLQARDHGLEINCVPSGRSNRATLTVILNGEPVEVDTTVNVNFALAQ